MINTKNIIMIASITAVLGFGIAALQTNTTTVDAFMDNTSEILDIGEKSEITTLAKKDGGGKDGGGKGGKTSPLEGQGVSADRETTVKCSASNLLKCTIKNSGQGMNSVSLGIDMGTVANCDIKNVKDGASRASIDTRGTDCKYDSSLVYQLDVSLAPNNALRCFSIYVISNADLTQELIVVECSLNA